MFRFNSLTVFLHQNWFFFLLAFFFMLTISSWNEVFAHIFFFFWLTSYNYAKQMKRWRPSLEDEWILVLWRELSCFLIWPDYDSEEINVHSTSLFYWDKKTFSMQFAIWLDNVSCYLKFSKHLMCMWKKYSDFY